jgi:hypothetical protein
MFMFSFLAGTMAEANPPVLVSGINIQKIDDSKSFRLRLGALPTGKVEVFFKDAAGKVLYREDVSGKDSYSKLFELEDLPEGVYVLSLDEPASVTSQPIVVKTNKLHINGTEREKVFKPLFEEEGRAALVTLLSVKPTKVKVRAEDGSGRTLWKERLVVNRQMDARYDLARFGSGDYTLVVEIEGRSYRKDYKIR